MRIVTLSLLMLGMTLPLHALEREIWGSYKLGMVGAERGSLVYAAAKAGARDAAKAMEQKHKLKIDLVFAAPAQATTEGQDGILGEFFIEGVQGYAIDPNAGPDLLDEMDFLQAQGIPAVLFHRDQLGATGPRIQSDMRELGMLAATTLSQRLGSRGGTVAVLAGEPDNRYNQALLDGIKLAAQQPDNNLRPYGIFTCEENLTASLAEILSVQAADKDDRLDAWLFLGPWPMSGAAELPWKPGGMYCVSIGAHPAEFPYLKDGTVDALIAEKYYEWGYQSIVYLVHRLHLKSEPEGFSGFTGGEVVTRKNLAEYRAKWTEWLR